MRLSRRAFVRDTLMRSMGGASALGGLALHGSVPVGSTPRFAYAASVTGDSVYVFAIDGERWTALQAVTSRAPVFLVMHPGRRALYVVNDVDAHEGLPRGTVEAYAIDPDSGHLR